MRIVSYGVACSLDGFIAGPHGEIDWLHFSTDVEEIMKSYWTSIDTMVMGRKTWDATVAMGGGGGSSTIATHVFSRTLKEGTHLGVQIVSSDPGEFVRALKRTPGGDICVMGGGELAQTLFAAGFCPFCPLSVHSVHWT